MGSGDAGGTDEVTTHGVRASIAGETASDTTGTGLIGRSLANRFPVYLWVVQVPGKPEMGRGGLPPLRRIQRGK